MTPDRTQLVERYLRGEIDAVEPRDAATVVLLCDGPAGPEVYLLRRPTKAFAAGMHVFPGGAVAPPTRTPRWGQRAPGRRRQGRPRDLATGHRGVRRFP